MSRIGKKPISLPSGVEVKIDGGFVVAKGPKGELKKPLPSGMVAEVSEGQLWIKPLPGQEDESAKWGLARSLISNMIKGVAKGFDRVLTFQGVGFRASANGSNLELSLGFSHPVRVAAPVEITFKVEKNRIIVSGIDKEQVGQIAASVRRLRVPEPYKGSGIKYEEEVIIKKAGKKAVVTSG